MQHMIFFFYFNETNFSSTFFSYFLIKKDFHEWGVCTVYIRTTGVTGFRKYSQF